MGDFPLQTLPTDRKLFRVVRQGNGPWWFGSSKEGRFDLSKPEGTCYLAAEKLAALLEILGTDLEKGIVSSLFIEERRLRELSLPRDFSLADLTSRKAVGFGITAEIGSIVPYDLPQAWAAKLREAGAEGLIYWLRHDPSRTQGIALFDQHGEREDWSEGREYAISAELIERLRIECGIEVRDVPRSDQLSFVEV